MIAGTLYYVVVTARRQAVLAPALVFVAIVGMVYATDAGPAMQAATVPAAALLPIAAWIMRLVATAESKPFADVTLVTLGSNAKRHVCRGAAALLYTAALSVVATLWARVMNPHPYPVTVIAGVLVMTFVLGLAGVGLGSLLSPPLGATAGAASIAVTILALLTIVLRWLPPIGPVLTAVLLHHASPLVPLLEAALVGVAAFVIALRLQRHAR